MKTRGRCGAYAVLIIMFCVIAGCSKKAQRDDPKLNDPPPDGEAQVAMPAGPPVVRQQGGDDVSQPESEDTDAVVTRPQLDRFLDRGPSYVLTIVTVEPVHSPAGFVGYQITEVTTEARAFMTPQLRVGDVVTHINGLRLLRPEDYMQAWRSLDKVSTIRVDFTRQGEQMNAVWAVK